MPQQEQDLTNLFSTDLSNVETVAPLLMAGTYDVKVVEAKITDNKAKDGKNIEFQFVTNYPAVNTKGGKVEAGHKLYHYLSLKDTDKEGRPRIDMIQRELKKIMDAAGRKGSFGQPSSYLGTTMKVTIDIESDSKGQYGDKNVIRKFIPKN